jgi:hypothetical protein
MSYAASAGTSTWAYAQRVPGEPVLKSMGNSTLRFGADIGSTLQVRSEILRAVGPGAALGIRTPAAAVQTVHRATELLSAFTAAYEIATQTAADDEMDLPNLSIWGLALTVLVGLGRSLDVSTPLMTPLQLGGLAAEWHEHGLNIEIRFRGAAD